MKDRYRESGLVPAKLREGQGVYVILVGVPPVHFKLTNVPHERQIRTVTLATKDAHIIRSANLSSEQIGRIGEYMVEGRPVDQEFYDELKRPRRPIPSEVPQR